MTLPHFLTFDIWTKQMLPCFILLYIESNWNDNGSVLCLNLSNFNTWNSNLIQYLCSNPRKLPKNVAFFFLLKVGTFLPIRHIFEDRTLINRYGNSRAREKNTKFKIHVYLNCNRGFVVVVAVVGFLHFQLYIFYLFSNAKWCSQFSNAIVPNECVFRIWVYEHQLCAWARAYCIKNLWSQAFHSHVL